MNKKLPEGDEMPLLREEYVKEEVVARAWCSGFFRYQLFRANKVLKFAG